MHETHEAARAVAALLDLAAVGIEDPIAEIDAWLPSPLNEQNLVAADAEMAVSQQAQLLLPSVRPTGARRRARQSRCRVRAS
jgi:hypothetical protein